jgi:plastocyanin
MFFGGMICRHKWADSHSHNPIEIHSGQTIRWLNEDLIAHTVPIAQPTMI